MRSTSLRLFNSNIQIENYNNDFLLLKADASEQLVRIGNAIYQQGFDFVEEVIVTEVEVCIKLNADFSASKLEALKNLKVANEATVRNYQLPVFFNDHEDWQLVLDHSGLTKPEVIQLLEQSTLTLAMFGFLPGFLYLRGLPEILQVPRKTVPAKYVDAKSIAIGGKYLGCYTLDSPGGWNVIGQMPLQVLQLEKLPPIQLQPGDTITLKSIDQETYDKLLQQSITIIDYNA